MRAQDRYTKIIESLVNGDSASAEDLLHEAFVEKAREIWSDLVEQDEIVEDDIAEEELEEAFGDEESDDFLNDIETADEEIEAEEAFGEAEDEDEGELDADMELAADDGFDAEGGEGDLEDAIMSVEDALADLKAEFAKLMGDDMADDEEGDDMEDGEAEFDMDMGDDMADDEEVEEEFAFEAEEDLEEEAEELEESAELKKVGKDKAIHPVQMPAGDDGKASPVSKGLEDPFSGKGNNTKADPVDFTGDKEAGRSAPKAASMSGFKPPGEGASLSAAPKAKR